MANVTFGQYANNLAKQQVRQQEKHDRTVLVATAVGLILAIAVIFGWVGLSQQSPIGDGTARLELSPQNHSVDTLAAQTVRLD